MMFDIAEFQKENSGDGGETNDICGEWAVVGFCGCGLGCDSREDMSAGL
jgi:hypothetical protein